MAYQDNEKRQVFEDRNIADDRQEEQVLKGIQPKNQFAFRMFKLFRVIAIVLAVLAVLLFSLTFIDAFNKFISAPPIKSIYNKTELVFAVGALGFLAMMLLTKVIFLRKAPFDDWVFEVAQRDLGTDLIFYTSKCLYIKYDIASAKEVDKKDFITKMSDLSIHYSYFYVNTFVDQQVIQVECTKKQPVPTKAVLNPEDDVFPNIIPVGLTINNTSQMVTPISWTLNTNNNNPNILETGPSVSFLIAGGTGSGKSVLEQNIINHVSHFSDEFQLVGVDCKVVEFNQLRGVKGVKGVALNVKAAASAIATFQKQMMNRFEFMAANQANNIYKLREIEVPYYTLWGRTYQFDEMFELYVDIDKESRDYTKLIMQYPDGRIPTIISIEEIYNGLENDEYENPSLPQVKGYNPYIKKGDITKTSGIFKPKILLFLVDEMNELMNSDDYKSVDTIKQAMGSIARLGRAAGVHLALAMQRASGGTVSSDLMNNIQQSILLGAFDSGSSTLMFEKDISNLAKPDIKGRAFMQVNKKEIYEVQTYWIEPEDSWEFDEERLDTYNNKVYLTQCKRRHKEIDNSGFVTPKLIAPDEIVEEPQVEEFEEDEWEDDDNWDTEDLGEPITTSSEKEKATEETKDKPISFSMKKNEENKTQFSAVEQVMAMQDNTEGLSKEEEETVKKVLKFKI